MIGDIFWYGLVAVWCAAVVFLVGFVVLMMAYFLSGLYRSLFPSKNPNCRKDR